MNYSITTQVRELQTMPAAQLAARYTELFGAPPRVRNVAWLRRQCAWQLQAAALGTLSDRTKARLDELMSRIDLPLGNTTPPRPRPTLRAKPRDPLVGTTLVREWHGQQIRVEVRENGFEWNGMLFKSLTATVRAITNSNWNPKIFFNLVQRKAAQ